MKNSENYTSYYFLGIGGIGMSALARYFRAKGYAVAGYDRVISQLCIDLEAEGILVSNDESVQAVPEQMLDKCHTLVVITPAIPADHPQLMMFRAQGFTIKKRSEVLGMLTRDLKALCVAGTHGKTTTSTILAHLLHQSETGCNAFLGGISNNYNSNLLTDPDSNLVVVEADEYDRSFLHLTPYMAIVTSRDPDHLDIYGTAEEYRKGFVDFIKLIKKGGILLAKKGVFEDDELKDINATVYTYSTDSEADFYADNINIAAGEIRFDFHTPTETITDLKLGVPVKINIENSVAAMAIAWLNGVTLHELRSGLSSYSGIYRRFNVLCSKGRNIVIDDYAHHPAEIHASIDSVRTAFADKKIIGVFQPHLYTRTRDFADGFAKELSKLDEVILLPIYPARELPIDGVDSKMLLDKITLQSKQLCQKNELIERLKQYNGCVILMLGAGDIDRLSPVVAKEMKV